MCRSFEGSEVEGIGVKHINGTKAWSLWSVCPDRGGAQIIGKKALRGKYALEQRQNGDNYTGK